ncbi:phosphotransferase [Microlunatus soli]|uniref:phosphotransferase n=1 Tax=Microlunatus soli TaxID=630515 RepID=UPI0012FA81EF|nr:phosphotransferase [Microlunatus soli]
MIGKDGRVRADPEAIARIRQQLRAEPALGALTDLAVLEAEWGASGLHFVGTWNATGADVIVKIGVSPSQRWWTEAISREDPALAPILFASGGRLGDIDLGWMVSERLPGGLHAGWHGQEFTMLMAAAARFHRFARRHPSGPHSVTTAGDVASWIDSAITRGVPGPAAALLGSVDQDWELVSQACPPEICHGDLHMANVLSRTPAPQLSDALLIDFEPCLMPWVFEAAYCQVLNSDPARVGWRELILLLDEQRGALGLPTISNIADLRRVETIVLGWYALRMWSIIGPDTDPAWRSPQIWRAAIDDYVSQAVQS